MNNVDSPTIYIISIILIKLNDSRVARTLGHVELYLEKLPFQWWTKERKASRALAFSGRMHVLII